MPHLPANHEAVREAMVLGTSAAYRMAPTHTTSMAKTGAAMGVRKIAENAADMPQSISTCLSRSARRNTRPSTLPTLPPSCNAAPSRPALPPQKWVTTVEMKISGAICIGSSVSARSEASTILVPLSFWS